MIGILLWIIIGGLAGWIAGMVMNRHHSVLVNIVIGIIGAVIGGWIVNLFGVHPSQGGFILNLVVAFIGSVVLLFILGLVNKPKA